MKNLTFISSICLCSLTLLGCNTVNSIDQAGGRVVSSGAYLGKTVIGSGAYAVSATGGFVDKTIHRGVDVVTGQPILYGPKIVYHNGHKYKLYNGRYILIR
jgi:predicted small secreted protein